MRQWLSLLQVFPRPTLGRKLLENTVVLEICATMSNFGNNIVALLISICLIPTSVSQLVPTWKWFKGDAELSPLPYHVGTYEYKTSEVPGGRSLLRQKRTIPSRERVGEKRSDHATCHSSSIPQSLSKADLLQREIIIMHAKIQGKRTHSIKYRQKTNQKSTP